MRTRLKDVAERAGVSVKTVSNVVNGYVHVTPHTRARVEAALAELNYRPNLAARNLRTGRTGVIALAVPELDLPYFAELARHVIAEAERRGHTVLIDQHEGSRDRERVVAAGIRAELIDGLIFSPLTLTAADLAERADQTPLVLLGERMDVANHPHSGQPQADHVVIDNIAAARQATAHLLGLGRRRIAAIGAQRGTKGATARLRLRGYRDALRAAHIPHDERLVAETDEYHRADGAAAMARILDAGAPPDAVFCFNDPLALGAMRTLADRRIRIPDDIAVIGFDDIEDGRYSVPTLSTISPDKAEIAARAVDMLSRRLAGDTTPPQEHFAGYQLLVRESSAAADSASA